MPSLICQSECASAGRESGVNLGVMAPVGVTFPVGVGTPAGPRSLNNAAWECLRLSGVVACRVQVIFKGTVVAIFVVSDHLLSS